MQRPRNEEGAPGAEFDGPSQMREIHQLPEQMTECHSKATDRAMLRLMAVLRRIAESSISEESEVAA